MNMTVPAINLAGVEYPLDRPHCIYIASFTSNRVYELRVWPHDRGVGTSCSCPARKDCVHRKTFAQIIGVQLGDAVVVSGAAIWWNRPLAVLPCEPDDPFEGLT